MILRQCHNCGEQKEVTDGMYGHGSIPGWFTIWRVPEATELPLPSFMREPGTPPLDFCSWACVGGYAAKHIFPEVTQ